MHGLEAGLHAAALGSYTIVNAGGVVGSGYAVFLQGKSTFTNTGLMQAQSTTSGAGVILGDGGAVTNGAATASAAVIEGYNGVAIDGQAGAVANDGTIAGSGKYGVTLQAGGLVTNGATNVTSALIEGGNLGIAAKGPATLRNYGVVEGMGTSGVGVYFDDGGSVTNGAAADTGATIEGFGIGVAIENAAGAVVNFGLIRANGTQTGGGAVLTNGGSVVNGSATDRTAEITGAIGVGIIGLAGTVSNFGTIDGRYMGTVFSAAGVYLAAGGKVTNGSASDATAAIEGGREGVGAAGGPATVVNYGVIRSLGAGAGVYLKAGGAITNGSAADTSAWISGDVGVVIYAQFGTVTNFGTIQSLYSSLLPAGAFLSKGGIVTNGSTAATHAVINGRIGVDLGGPTASTVINFGSIGDASSEAGVLMSYGGLVTNGSAADTTARIAGYVGVIAEGNLATVKNFGTIAAGGGAASVTGQYGVYLEAGGSVTNGSSTDTGASISGVFGVRDLANAATVSNFGSIYGSVQGVSLSAGGKVVNGSSTDTAAVIRGRRIGADVANAAGSIANFGTILGGPAGYGFLLRGRRRHQWFEHRPRRPHPGPGGGGRGRRPGGDQFRRSAKHPQRQQHRRHPSHRLPGSPTKPAA